MEATASARNESGYAQVGRKRLLTAAAASILGFSLDLFDLYILLYVAPVVGKLFFPSDTPTLSLAAVYASFAVSLFMRPFGSAIFGSYADRHGRRATMIIAFVGVGVSTAAFGLLPTINQIGVAASVLFLALRLVQGTFVGGVVASTHTIATETVPPSWRGSMSGLIGGGAAAIGALVASIFFGITSYFFPGDLYAVWGWRCMFFSGIVSAILGFVVFRLLEETPYFKELEQSRSGGGIARMPLRSLFSADYRSTLFVNLFVTCGAGVGYYLTSGYMPAFIKVVNGVSYGPASAILIGCAISGFVSSLLVGHISTLIGRKPTLLIFGIGAGVLAALAYIALGRTQDLAWIAILAISITFLGNIPLAPVLIILNERFPTRVRSSGTGLSWNIGFAFGGTMPTFVSLFSGGVGNIPATLAIFLLGGTVLFLIGSLIIPETRGHFE